MNDIEHTPHGRQIIINALAVAGFISLIGLGIWLAAYSTRFVPSVVGGIGSAAVSLGSVFNPAPEPSSLSVVPVDTSTATTTIIFGPDDLATSTATTTVVTAPASTAPKKIVPVTSGPATSGTYPIGGSSSTAGALYGFPDLIVSINAVGYLATSSADSFVATTTVNAGSRPAVRFTIKNVGSNRTGSWRFSASIPTRTAYIFQSELQQSLNPGDSIDYTLGFDQAIPGATQAITITANADKTVSESNQNNNIASTTLNILSA